VSPDEILHSVYDIYNTDSGSSPSLCSVSSSLSLSSSHPIISPRKKVTIMIIGNHSAGKSSFINWYMGRDREAVLPTGVAVESQGFSICTEGPPKTGGEVSRLKGEAVFRFLPHIAGIDKFGKNLLSNLELFVVPPSKGKSSGGTKETEEWKSLLSTTHSFSSVDIIDTPGMIDGNVSYPFDVDGVIDFLAEHVDMVLVFLDPIGQALCTRTMNVVERLNEKHYRKLKYYLSKADSIDKMIDLFKVSQQLTQNLASRVKNTHGFYVAPIFLTRETTSSSPSNPLSEINEIGSMCRDIELAVKNKVQTNLSTLERDCKVLEEEVERKIKEAEEAIALQAHRFYNAMAVLSLLLLLLAALGGLSLSAVLCCDSEHIVTRLTYEWLPAVMPLFNRASQFLYIQEIILWLSVPLFLSFIVLFVLYKSVPRVSKGYLQQAREGREAILRCSGRREALYKLYFSDIIPSDDD
jgi:predicted GTPase